MKSSSLSLNCDCVLFFALDVEILLPCLYKVIIAMLSETGCFPFASAFFFRSTAFVERWTVFPSFFWHSGKGWTKHSQMLLPCPPQ